MGSLHGIVDYDDDGVATREWMHEWMCILYDMSQTSNFVKIYANFFVVGFSEFLSDFRDSWTTAASCIYLYNYAFGVKLKLGWLSNFSN